MDIFSAFAVSFSLAADAMAVAVCCGLRSRNTDRKGALLTGGLFGFFQMLMSLLGWSIGKVGEPLTDGKESIISFVILLLLGIKMLSDSRHEPTEPLAAVGTKELVLFSIATSMDALALGTVLPLAVKAFSVFSLLTAVLLIGIVTFILSYSGFRFGHHFRRLSSRRAVFMSGCVLILLGFKILLMG